MLTKVRSLCVPPPLALSPQGLGVGPPAYLRNGVWMVCVRCESTCLVRWCGPRPCPTRGVCFACDFRAPSLNFLL
jgi:hypothetical protein